MARLVAFCFPGTGHINPMTVLARRLQQHGHPVVIFGIVDTESRARAAGVELHRIGKADYPMGTLEKLDRRLGGLKKGWQSSGSRSRVNTARMILRDGPGAVVADRTDSRG